MSAIGRKETLHASEAHAQIDLDDVEKARSLLPYHAVEVAKENASAIKDLFLNHKIEPYEKYNT